jgi:hypothetical protein
VDPLAAWALPRVQHAPRLQPADARDAHAQQARRLCTPETVRLRGHGRGFYPRTGARGGTIIAVDPFVPFMASSALLGLMMELLSRRNRRAAFLRMLAEMPVTASDRLHARFVRVSGRARSAGRSVIAPGTGRPCLACEIRRPIEPVEGPGPAADEPKAVCARFVVDDGAGRVVVDPGDDFVLLLEGGMVAAPGFAEVRLEDGAAVSVAGYAEIEIDPGGEAPEPRAMPVRWVLRGRPGSPLLVTTAPALCAARPAPTR